MSEQPGVVAAPPSPPPPDKQNVFSRIAGVLFAPAETFLAIARRPDVIGPLLVIVLVGYACTIVSMPKMDYSGILAQQAEQMQKQGRTMPEEQRAQIEKFTIAFAKGAGWIAPVLGVAWYALIAGVFLLAFRLMGGEGTYKQAFSITLYAWMPLLLFGIITAIVIAARGTFDPLTAATLVKSNPAFLVDMKEQPVLYSLLSSFDVFTIWTIALFAIGFAAMSRVSKTKAAVIVVSLWFVQIAIKVGFAAIGAARMKG